jgi:hypothetical protein
VAGERLRVVFYGVANVTRNRSREHDPERRVRCVAKQDAIAQAVFIDELFGIAA